MPILTVYRHGVTAGITSANAPPPRHSRSTCSGWSRDSTRGNLKFLRSVRPGSLDGHGYALTFTLRDCPPTAADWKALRELLFVRLRRSGMVRLHWVTEWQRRGVPHLHLAVWTREPLNPTEFHLLWLSIAGRYGAENRGQHVTPIHDATGWFRYVAKHAARGVAHYQRHHANVPPAWRSKTGRVWGRLGLWDLVDPVRLELDRPSYFRLRRIFRSVRIAEARMRGHGPSIRAARRCLRSVDRCRGEIRGLSEWLDAEDTLRVVGNLVDQGGAVAHIRSTKVRESIDDQ